MSAYVGRQQVSDEVLVLILAVSFHENFVEVLDFLRILDVFLNETDDD
jgi:hypothetical protein